MIRLLIIFLLFSSLCHSQTLMINGWHQGGFPGHRRLVTIDHTKCGTANTDSVTITLSGTYAYLKSEANGGYVKDAQGDDIYPSTDIEGVSPLKFEMVSWSASTGTIEMHILIPAITYNTDYQFYIQYGNVNITTFQGGSAGSAYRSTHKVIAHLSNGTTLSGAGSTANGLNLTLMSSPTATTGLIDGGADMGATLKWLEIQNSALNLTSFTYRAWAKSVSGTGYVFVRAQSGTSNFGAYLWWNSMSNQWTFGFNDGTSFKDHYYAGTSPDDGNWHDYAITMDDNANLIKLYIDGQLKVSETENGSPNTSGLQYLVYATDIYGFNHWYCKMDELMVNSTALTASELLILHNNEYSPSTFYTIGSQL